MNDSATATAQSQALSRTAGANSLGELLQQQPAPQGREATVVPLDRETLTFYGNMITAANLVPQVNNVPAEVQKYRVMAKIVAGVSYGFDPVLSQQCFDIMFNQLQPNARCKEILFKDSGEYDWRIVYKNETGCKLKILQRLEGDWDSSRNQYTGGRWVVLGEIEFTVEMARKAGLWDKKDSLWPKYPGDLAFARCITRAVNHFNPGCMRPRTLLGNYFAKQPDKISAPAPVEEPLPTMPETPREPAAPAAVVPTPEAGDSYIDAPYLEADEGVEASIVDHSTGTAHTGPEPWDETPAIQGEPVDPDESKRANLIAGIEELLPQKGFGMPSDRKRFLKGRDLHNEEISVLEGLYKELDQMP